MQRWDSAGRVPFTLVAVLLLLSMGVSAIFAAQLAREEASWRLEEAELATLGRVVDAAHNEVVAQSQHLAIGAIRAGTEGLMNETRIRRLFQESLATYLSTRFPKSMRNVEISIIGFGGDLRLTERRMLDFAPAPSIERDLIGGIPVDVPNPRTADSWEEVRRLAYFVVHGFVNYRAALDRVTLERAASLETIVPLPAPFMEARIERLARTGMGDATGVGRTVKAILGALVQLRVLDGFASPIRPGTTTADVLAPRDVQLAVNLAILIEEIRSFRAYSEEAAAAIDEAYGLQGRPLGGLLDRFAASGTLDAVDLYALYARLDETGIHLGAVLAQAIASFTDDAVLKHLDYLGLTPLADFLTNFFESSANVVESFLDWLLDNPPKEAEYIRGYLSLLFDEAEAPTTYLGPRAVHLPDRTYDVPNGSSSIRISIPAHSHTVSFAQRNLLSRSLDDFWVEYYPMFAGGVRDVHAGIRDLANDVAARLGRDAVLAGLLSETASGPINPKDDEPFLETLASRVEEAVGKAAEHVRASLFSGGAFTHGLLEAATRMGERLVDHLVASYATLAGESHEVTQGETALAADLHMRAAQDARFRELSEAQRAVLQEMIRNDVNASRWVSGAFAEIRARDSAIWREVASGADGTALSRNLREGLREAMVGAGGWLALAGDTVSRMMRESIHALQAGSTGSRFATRLGSFEMWEASNPDQKSNERFRVRHTPTLVRGSPHGQGFQIEVLDPAGVPRTPETPNVHHTRPFERSDRPFQTRWTVHVRGLLTVRGETERAVLLGPRGLEPLVLEEAWPMDFTFAVDAHSGWSLAGVAYHDSNDLLGNTWEFLLRFLDEAWDPLSQMASWILDALRGALRVLMEAVDPLVGFVHKVVELLTNIVRTLVDLLYQVAVGTLQTILSAVDWSVEQMPTTTLVVPVLGMSYRFVVNGGGGRELQVDLDAGPLDVGASFVDLQEMGVASDLRYDVVAWWQVTLGPYRMDVDIDPLRLVQRHILVGSAEWAGWWRLDLEGLFLESYLGFSRSIPLGWIPIPPYGDVEIEIGFELVLTEHPLPIVLDLIESTIAESFADVAGLELSLEYVIRFAESLVRRFAENVLEVVDRHGDDFLVVTVYIEAEFDVGTGSPLGIGGRLSFVADGAAVVAIVAWVAQHVAVYLRSLLSPFAISEFPHLSVNLLEHLFIRLEVHVSVEPPMPARVVLQQIDVELQLRAVAAIEANVAFFGSLMGQEWGSWKVNFGVYVELPEVLARIFGAPSGSTANLWFLRGSLRPY